MLIYSEIPGKNNEVLEDNSPGGDNVEVFILNPAGNNYVPSLPPSKELISILQYMKVSNTVVPSQDNKDMLLICEEVPYTYKTNIGDDRISKHVKDCPLLDLQMKARRRSI